MHAQLSNDTSIVHPLEDPNLFEGDIVATAEDLAAVYGTPNVVSSTS